MATRTTVDRSTVSARLGVCAAALGGVAGTTTDAFGQIVTFSPNLNVPNNFDGVYINLLNGTTGTSGAGTPGWDFNPYNAGTQLQFFWNTATANTSGGVATGTTYNSLPNGTVIDGTSNFSTTPGGTVGSPFHTTGTHTLGFRFFNENTNAVNFGHMTISTTANTSPNVGFPVTIVSWSFESSGGPIVVPEPATIGLTCAAMALGARGLRRWRREKQLAA